MRHFHTILITILSIFGLGENLMAQDEPFKGGSGDGFTIDTASVELVDLNKGGNGDGHALAILTNGINAITAGGSGDGYSNFVLQNQDMAITKGGGADGFGYFLMTNADNSIFAGGISDGFGSIKLQATDNSIFAGGISDGFGSVKFQTNDNSIFSGGISDGFAYEKYGHIIYWTGAVGTGWNVEDNWEDGIIPSYCNPVIIPSGVPNFPAVNSGLLRIGYYKDEGDFRCQRIKIEQNAEMTTRVNCFVENYNMVLIQGTFFVKNPALDAFRNMHDGIILLKPTGSMIVKE